MRTSFGAIQKSIKFEDRFFRCWKKRRQRNRAQIILIRKYYKVSLLLRILINVSSGKLGSLETGLRISTENGGSEAEDRDFHEPRPFDQENRCGRPEDIHFAAHRAVQRQVAFIADRSIQQSIEHLQELHVRNLDINIYHACAETDARLHKYYSLRVLTTHNKGNTFFPALSLRKRDPETSWQQL
jgi:hypothetical protein